MASPLESSYHASGSGLTRRTGGSANRVAPDSLRPDVEPPPRPKPGMQKLAIIAIVALGCIQLFLSPTHFRDPKDPHRSWIPIDPTSSTPIVSIHLSWHRSTCGGHLCFKLLQVIFLKVNYCKLLRWKKMLSYDVYLSVGSSYISTGFQ